MHRFHQLEPWRIALSTGERGHSVLSSAFRYERKMQENHPGYSSADLPLDDVELWLAGPDANDADAE